MRVLLVNKFYYRRAGAEAYLLDLEKALQDAGHQTAIFATSHPETLPTPWSKYFVRYRDFSRRDGALADAAKVTNMIWSSEAARAVGRLLADFKPEIVHLHNIYHHLSPSVIAECRRAGVPVVQTLHDWKFVCPNYKLFTDHAACERCHVYRYWNAAFFRCMHGSLSASAAAAIEMWVHRVLAIYEKGVSRFIVPSAFMRELFVRWGKDGHKIIHLPNLLDLSELPPPSPDPGDGALFVGRFEEWKGVTSVLAAAAAAPEISFRLAGSGPLEEDLCRRAAELKLSNVVFLGRLERAAVYREMLRARAVLVPSIGYDPFPTVALEAGALSRPVVAARIGGLPEIVVQGQTGLLAPPQDASALIDAVKKLHYDPALAVRLGRAARERVRRLVDPAEHLRRLLAVYSEVVAESVQSN